MHVPVAALGSWNAAWRLVLIGAVAGVVWQSRQACCSHAFRFSGRLGWWQAAQLPSPLRACFSWSKVTTPSFAGSMILPFGRGGASLLVFGATVVGGSGAVVVVVAVVVVGVVVVVVATTAAGGGAGAEIVVGGAVATAEASVAGTAGVVDATGG
jgi:hypothetical protein